MDCVGVRYNGLLSDSEELMSIKSELEHSMVKLDICFTTQFVAYIYALKDKFV